MQAYGRTRVQVAVWRTKAAHWSRRPYARTPVRLLVGVSLLLGCGTGTDHERIGDRRYAEGAWLDALAEYRLAARQRRATPALQTKLGLAALRAGVLGEAVETYRELADQDPITRHEAVEGLVRAGRLATAARDVRALRLAVRALRDVAPQRLGELGPGLALSLEQERAPGDEELILTAAAHAGRSGADSLLVAWAEVAVRSGRCEVAARGLEAVVRRGAASLGRGVRGALALCRIEEGRSALGDGRLLDAEAAFVAAIATGTPDSTARLAWLLIGDTRWAGGDSAGAAEAYESAIAGGDETSATVRRAEEQLRRLLGTPPDT